MISFTKKEALENINSLKILEDVCSKLDDKEQIPFYVSDVHMLIGLITHLAKAANYLED